MVGVHRVAKRIRDQQARAGKAVHSLALLAMVASVGSASTAAASTPYWPDGAPDYYLDAPPPPYDAPRRRYLPRNHHAAKRTVAPAAVKPHGPMIVAVSIDRQSLKLYDDNGLFAETPVSTGMHGHDTPRGVFSVIQKQTWHQSNIYSGAPMPYMQRITWSGIAMHAGVLPGYPASHGCIRMPMNFAVKMFHWTRMGARVIVTAGDVEPTAISHPLLVTQKPAPILAAAALAAEAAPDASKPVVATRTADAGLAAAASPAAIVISDALPNAELRLTIGAPASDNAASPADVAPAPASPDDKPPAAARTPTGPVAVFISRKDSRLYVRQNFTPLFDVPVAIAPDERPLGTHVFTAHADGADAGSFRWSVVSMPTSRRAETSDSPAEALNRLTIPPDAMTRIALALTPGSSIVVSDQGIAGGETGQGTDFIVLSR